MRTGLARAKQQVFIQRFCGDIDLHLSVYGGNSVVLLPGCFAYTGIDLDGLGVNFLSVHLQTNREVHGEGCGFSDVPGNFVFPRF